MVGVSLSAGLALGVEGLMTSWILAPSRGTTATRTPCLVRPRALPPRAHRRCQLDPAARLATASLSAASSTCRSAGRDGPSPALLGDCRRAITPPAMSWSSRSGAAPRQIRAGQAKQTDLIRHRHRRAKAVRSQSELFPHSRRSRRQPYDKPSQGTTIVELSEAMGWLPHDLLDEASRDQLHRDLMRRAAFQLLGRRNAAIVSGATLKTSDTAAICRRDSRPSNRSRMIARGKMPTAPAPKP